MIPRYQYGYIMPVQTSEFLHYNFYQLCSADSVFVGAPLNLQSFSADGVESAFREFWRVHDFLVSRQVDRISQGGIPISARLGRKRVLQFIEEAAKRSPIPTDADFEESIAGLRAVGAKTVTVGAKWEPTLMADVARYLTEAGFEVVATEGDPHTAPEVLGLTPRRGHEIALALGRAAFRAAPRADALLLAGGAWQNLPAAIEVEREFGRPVVTNPTASIWAFLRQIGQKATKTGVGRLFETL